MNRYEFILVREWGGDLVYRQPGRIGRQYRSAVIGFLQFCKKLMFQRHIFGDRFYDEIRCGVR